MKAIEAVEAADSIAPNQYPAEQKLSWLKSFDGKVFLELIAEHFDPETYTAYMDADYDDVNVVLLIPEPYARDTYVNYLLSKIAEANMEGDRYNMCATAFNAAYQEYASWYNRTHAPLCRKGWMF